MIDRIMENYAYLARGYSSIKLWLEGTLELCDNLAKRWESRVDLDLVWGTARGYLAQCDRV